MLRARRLLSTTKPDLDRQLRRPGEDRAVASNLVGEVLTPLSPEVALDEQGDCSVANANPRDRVRTQVAIEQSGRSPLRDPAEDALTLL